MQELNPLLEQRLVRISTKHPSSLFSHLKEVVGDAGIEPFA